MAVTTINPNARATIISGYDIEDVRKEMPEHLNVAFLEKPCSIDQLRESDELEANVTTRVIRIDAKRSFVLLDCHR